MITGTIEEADVPVSNSTTVGISDIIHRAYPTATAGSPSDISEDSAIWGQVLAGEDLSSGD
jgi:hypothetical protein